ncbi:MAG: inorganic pyrophosphatase [Candidatus Eisenbacteria bacterium RBG_16_71_46]|nr:MAG: inorganic pyrophosphatase [Candidatus Eisenbacteria bacterium RBG_16_71_46]
MSARAADSLRRLLGLLFQSHPWHGVSPGPDAPAVVTVFIELVSTDTVKYEIDKESGLLKLDRPQRYSSLSPEPYGFVPRTLCDREVAERASGASTPSGLRGDQDPLDACVLTDRPLNHGGVLVRARPIGGLRMLDGNDVDDKIIAVLESDPTYETWQDLGDCPAVLVDRLKHYFLTYKDMPGTGSRRSELLGTYGADEARAVIEAARRDYLARFGDLERLLRDAAAQRPGS